MISINFYILELEQKKKHSTWNTGITFIPFVKEDINQQHKEVGHPTASKRLDTPSRRGQKNAIPRYRPDIS